MRLGLLYFTIRGMLSSMTRVSAARPRGASRALRFLLFAWLAWVVAAGGAAAAGRDVPAGTVLLRGGSARVEPARARRRRGGKGSREVRNWTCVYLGDLLALPEGVSASYAAWDDGGCRLDGPGVYVFDEYGVLRSERWGWRPVYRYRLYLAVDTVHLKMGLPPGRWRLERKGIVRRRRGWDERFEEVPVYEDVLEDEQPVYYRLAEGAALAGGPEGEYRFIARGEALVGVLGRGVFLRGGRMLCYMRSRGELPLEVWLPGVRIYGRDSLLGIRYRGADVAELRCYRGGVAVVKEPEGRRIASLSRGGELVLPLADLASSGAVRVVKRRFIRDHRKLRMLAVEFRKRLDSALDEALRGGGAPAAVSSGTRGTSRTGVRAAAAHPRGGTAPRRTSGRPGTLERSAHGGGSPAGPPRGEGEDRYIDPFVDSETMGTLQKEWR